MTDAEFNTISHHFLDNIRSRTPYRTGNLKMNATKIQALGNSRFDISIDMNIAPYFKYVNNYETIRERRNNNYHYFEDAVEICTEEMALAIGGELSRV